mmetsp:Transcript_117530/g.366054  ORF Transcript_117530/g.366054 Transcript_117530/m.366054 type:complete len:701 (+) Transcript_117530:67-2169(+)
MHNWRPSPTWQPSHLAAGNTRNHKGASACNAGNQSLPWAAARRAGPALATSGREVHLELAPLPRRRGLAGLPPPARARVRLVGGQVWVRLGVGSQGPARRGGALLHPRRAVATAAGGLQGFGVRSINGDAALAREAAEALGRGAAKVVEQWLRPLAVDGVQQRGEDAPGLHELAAAYEERAVALRRLEEHPLVGVRDVAAGEGATVGHVEVHGRHAVLAPARLLHGAVQVDGRVRLDADHQLIGLAGHEGVVGLPPERHAHLGEALVQALPRPDEERHAPPAFVVHRQHHCRVGRATRAGRHRLIVEVPRLRARRTVGGHPGAASELAQEAVVHPERAGGPQQPALLRGDVLRVQPCRRLHRQPHEDLQQMVLHHVPDDAELIEVTASAARAEALLPDDLHLRDVVAAPERLVELVAETERHEVQHVLLGQVVVDAEELLLVEAPQGGLVQLLEAPAVAPERLLDDEAREASRRAGTLVDLLADAAEDCRRDGQEEDPAAALAALQVRKVPAEPRKVLLLVVRALEVGDCLQELVPALAPDAGALLLQECPELHVRAAVADDPRGDWQERGVGAAVHQLVESGEELLLREVARGTEDHDGERSHGRLVRHRSELQPAALELPLDDAPVRHDSVQPIVQARRPPVGEAGLLGAQLAIVNEELALLLRGHDDALPLNELRQKACLLGGRLARGVHRPRTSRC